MVAIQMRGVGAIMTDKKLRSAGISACVRHGQYAAVVVLVAPFQLAINFIARAARAGTGWIAALYHEIRDHPVKDYIIIKTRFGEFFKIGHRVRGVGVIKFNVMVALLVLKISFVIIFLNGKEK